MKFLIISAAVIISIIYGHTWFIDNSMFRLFTKLSTRIYQVTRMSSTLSDIPVFTKLSSDVVRILGCNPGHMTLQGTNTYVVGSGCRRILIDTGDADKPDYINALDSFLTSEKVEIDRILITHWHHDHIDGVKDVVKLDRVKNAEVWKFPRSDEKENYDFPVKSLVDQQEFPVDNGSLKVVYTPGHTTDHVCFVMSSDNSLFSGDCILGETTAVFEDLYDYMKSLDKILKVKPSVIYPGHGPVVQDPIEKIEYYIKHRQQREAQIVGFLKSHSADSFTEMEIVEQIYVGTPKELFPAAAYNVNHHLNKLQKEGQVVVVASDNGTNKWKYSGQATDHKL